MADVQTNLLSYILTKLHSDVARIESLIHQVHTDVEYLLQARQISDEDAQLILSKVPQPIHVDPAPCPPVALIQPASSLHLTTLPTPVLSSNIQPAASPPVRQPPPPQSPPAQGQSGGAAAKRAVPPPPKKVQARALWDYNIDGDEPKDLTFYKDDIIEIISESNADWWTGKVNGRTGLFPSNYVEKLVHPVPPALANLNSSSPSNLQPIVLHAHQPQPQPEASQQQYVPYRGAQAPPVHQESDKAEKKEGKYSQLKSTMAHSAAGGLGFGAGAAIGGGLVRAIF